MSVEFSAASFQALNPGANLDVFQNQNEASLMCWFKYANRVGSQDHIVAFSTGTSPTSARMYLTLNDSGGGNSNIFSSSRRLDTDGVDVAGSANVSAGVWHHAAGVCNFSGQSHQIYIDGVLFIDTTPFSWVGPTSNTPSQQGSVNSLADGTGGYGNTEIADIRAYRRALSAGEIMNIYQTRGADKISDFYHRWPMNEGSSGVAVSINPDIRDLGVGGLNIPAVNSPLWRASSIHSRARRNTG